MLSRISSPILIAADGEQVYQARSDSVYRGIRAHDVGNGLFVFASPVNNVEISDVEVTGGYRVIENTGSGGSEAPFERLLVTGARATGLRRGFARMRYASRGGRFRNITAEGVLTTGATDLPVGIALNDTASDFQFERCVMRGFRWQREAGQYWNGDGFSTERGNHDIRFSGCEAWDNSDGGFDLKSTGTVLDDCVSGRNARNYRLWSDITATRLTSVSPGKVGGRGDTNHISLMASKTAGAPPLVIRIQHLIVRSDQAWPIFDIYNGPAQIFVESHDIAVPPGTPLTRSRGGGQAVGGVQFAGTPPQL